MTKTAPCEMTLRRCTSWLAALCCALLLAACGPGTGGTGTGPISGPLSFSGTSAPSAGAPSMGNCVGDCSTAQLRLEEAAVELAAPCARFLHEGPWTVSDSGLARVSGTWSTQSGGATRSVAATLQLQFVGDPDASPQVVLVVLDEAGAALLGPLTLQRTANSAPPLAASCS